MGAFIQHEALDAAGATPFCLSFQCIKLPPVMTSYAIIALTATFLSYGPTGPLTTSAKKP